MSRKPTAVEKLRPSRLKQDHLMGEQVDLGGLYLALNHKEIDIMEAVTEVQIQRTVEGASTVTVSVTDHDRTLLRSGRLAARLDTEIDGLFFRLVSLRKQGSGLDLIFEDREIAIARTYNRPIKQSLSTTRARVTRAEFALRLLREIKELPPIPYVIPELHTTQDIAGISGVADTKTKAANRDFGIPKINGCTVKGAKMDEEQRRNANIILDVGSSRELPRRELVMAMMCAIQESQIKNLRQPTPGAFNHLSFNSEYNPVGVFQQIRHWGWPASRDVAKDASAFFDHLDPKAKVQPNAPYYNLIEQIQNSGDAGAYAKWRTEAERIVAEYGSPGDSVANMNAQWSAQMSTGDYEFYRGIPPSSSYQRKRGKTQWGRESSWDCWQRLANEVQWRCFFVSGTFYFIAEDRLYRSQPIAMLSEDTEGIDSIDGDLDEGKPGASLTVSCRIGRWAAPPGSVVGITDMGPWNGRWLVNDINRSAFSQQATITLKKPMPRLPEPAGSNLASGATSVTWTGAPKPKLSPSASTWEVGALKLVQPVPRGYNAKIIQGIHSTAGLSGEAYSYFPGTWPAHDACDFGGDAGAPVLACESGTITHVSGHDPSIGPADPVMGVTGPFGWSLYLKGDSGATYYYTHLGSRIAITGARVQAGQKMGTIGNYARFGGANHVHVGVNPPGSGHPDITDLMSAPLVGGGV